MRELNHELKFFNYYRKFVEWYVWIKRPLHRLKIKKFKNASIKSSARLRWAIRTKLKNFINDEFESNFDSKKKKSESKAKKSEFANSKIKNSTAKNIFLMLISIKECVRAWKRLKKKLIKAPILIFFDFSLSFILYTDDSKKKRFEIAFHQIEKNDVEKSILFLSRSLNNAEIRYWVTKLKTEILIWVLTKFSQYFDEGPFIVMIDYSTLKTALQTKITDRKSARFNE